MPERVSCLINILGTRLLPRSGSPRREKYLFCTFIDLRYIADKRSFVCYIKRKAIKNFAWEERDGQDISDNLYGRTDTTITEEPGLLTTHQPLTFVLNTIIYYPWQSSGLDAESAVCWC